MTTINTFKPTVQIINEQGAKTPCIARIYKDGQRRQCYVHYYKLAPLLDKNNVQIKNINDRPIYVAKKETN
jgi:hypothetical protein